MRRGLLEDRSREVKLKISIELADRSIAEALYKAILPEADSPVDEKRGKVSLYLEGNTVILAISSDTLSGVRALLNTYAYLLETLRKVVIAEL